MACCILFRHSWSSSSSSSLNSNVRVVDLNGCVEEFEYPVKVSQVITERPQKHYFMFTAAELLSVGSLKPLKPETLLEPGCIYFLLPSSAFGYEVSPLDLVGIVKKLTAKANSFRKSEGIKKNLLLPTSAHNNSPDSSSPEWNSPSSRLSHNNPMGDAGGGVEKLSRKRTWSPILDTINEVSSKSSSVLDLQEVHD